MPAVYNEAVAARARAAMFAQRVVLTGHFNSNGLFGGYGIVEAIQQALVTAGVKLFAAGPVAMTCTDEATGLTNLNVNPRSGFNCVGWQRVGTGQGANALLDPTNTLALHAFEAARYNYGRGNDGANVQYPGLYRGLHFKNNAAVGFGGVACGIQFPATPTNPLHINAAQEIKSDFWYANNSATGGTFRPVALTNGVPNSHVVNFGSNIAIGVGTPTAMLRATLSVPAGARDTLLRVSAAGGILSPADMRPTGEVFFGFQTAWENVPIGAMVAPFTATGGWSTYDMANNLARTDGSACSPLAISHWIDVCVRPTLDASQDPVMVWFVNEGSNTSSELATSITQGLTAGTWQAYADNVLYVCQAVLAEWIKKGYKARNCMFCLHPDHPRVGASNNNQALYRTLALDYLSSRLPDQIFGLDSDFVWTAAEITNAGRGNTSNYAYSASSNTLSNIAVSSGGNCVVTIPNPDNQYGGATHVTFSGTNSTPNINGTWRVVSRDTTQIVIECGDVTVAGNAGICRPVDNDHLSVAGIGFSNTHFYRTYWNRLDLAWGAANPSIGPGALGSSRSASSFQGSRFSR